MYVLTDWISGWIPIGFEHESRREILLYGVAAGSTSLWAVLRGAG